MTGRVSMVDLTDALRCADRESVIAAVREQLSRLAIRIDQRMALGVPQKDFDDCQKIREAIIKAKIIFEAYVKAEKV